MPNFENIGREIERRGKTQQIKSIAESPDGKKLNDMIDARALDEAARSGDNDAIRRMISQVLSTEEGRRLAENVKKLMDS